MYNATDYNVETTEDLHTSTVFYSCYQDFIKDCLINDKEELLRTLNKVTENDENFDSNDHTRLERDVLSRLSNLESTAKPSCYFNGNTSLEQALDLYNKRYKIDTKDIDYVVSNLKKTFMKGVETSFSYDVVGEEVDVGAYLNGEPECVIKVSEDYAYKRRVMITPNVCFNSNITTNEIKRIGKIYYGIYFYLKNVMNYDVKIIIRLPSRNRSLLPCKAKGNIEQYFELLIDLTPEEEILDETLLAFVFTNAHTLRHFVLRWEKIWSGYKGVEAMYSTLDHGQAVTSSVVHKRVKDFLNIKGNIGADTQFLNINQSNLPYINENSLKPFVEKILNGE